MATIQHYQQTKFLTVTTEQNFVRYFMGRKYYISRHLTHFVYPHSHEKNFSELREYTFRYTHQYTGSYTGSYRWYGLTRAPVRSNVKVW